VQPEMQWIYEVIVDELCKPDTDFIFHFEFRRNFLYILHTTVATHHRNTYIIHLLESRVMRGILLGRGYGIKSLPKWLHQTF
jgi:hypothetical protein